MKHWTDYETNSQLILVFGRISAKIFYLGRNSAGVPNHFGIIIPWDVIELIPGPEGDPTLEEAKEAAERSLRSILTLALAGLPAEPVPMKGSTTSILD